MLISSLFIIITCDRRGAASLLSVSEDLKLIDKSNNDMPYGDALYFQQGLLAECDGMHLWSAH